MGDDRATSRLDSTGFGDTQRRLLDSLKRGAPRSVPELAAEVGLAAETVRGHLNALAGRGLVRRAGRRTEGPGRPEILYELTERAEPLFPSAEGELLRELTAWLAREGHEEALRDFFRARVARKGADARGRVRGLRGRDRLEEVAAILSEDGFMAEVVDDEEGVPKLRLCHCPIREMVAASDLPCQAEIAWVRALLGEELARRSWMPEGDRTCTYAVGG